MSKKQESSSKLSSTNPSTSNTRISTSSAVRNTEDEKTVILSVSNSSDSTSIKKDKEQGVEKRFVYWKDMVDERKRIAFDIKEKMGKITSDVFYQKTSTREEPKKKLIKQDVHKINLSEVPMLSKRQIHKMQNQSKEKQRAPAPSLQEEDEETLPCPRIVCPPIIGKAKPANFLKPLKEMTASKRRASTMSSKIDRSSVNKFSAGSTPSSQLGTNVHRDVTEAHERDVVLEIVDRIFDEKTGIISMSSSSCSTPQNRSKERVYDKRLQYWKDMLEERKKIASKIQAKFGKPPADVLFQQRSTYEERDKSMVKRVMDYGERLNPVTLAHKTLLRSREHLDRNTCLNITEVRETIPRAEMKQETIVEITGMPAIAKEEQLGKEIEPCKKTWLSSKILKQRIEEKREDIERVIEFYPDIEHLQVVGESLLKGAIVKHNSEIELLHEEVIREISTDTMESVEECKCEMKLVKIEEPLIYGLKVNEHVYIANAKRSSQFVEVEVRFECYPFEHVVKRVMHLENIGEKVINIELVPRNYYTKVQSLLRTTDSEFLFDTSAFRLVAGEKRDIIVLYRPRKVDVVKQQWLLKLEPQFFCRKSDAIVLKLSGRCKPPIEYAEKISGLLHYVVEKSNLKMMRKLEHNLGSLAPLIKPSEIICPYRRSLDERELFEQLNPGYTCERFHDLELLKDIHKRLKKPREPVWDLKIKTLDGFIMRLESADQRALVFNEMTSILESMKGTPIELEIRVEENPERERSRFLYVRGIISSGIDEWEEIAFSIEEVFVKQAIKLYHARDELKVKTEGIGEGDVKVEEEPTSPDLLIFDKDENALREFMTKKVRRQKPFRDSLYMQTYTLLCNFVEDIVSIIESTEIV